MGLHVLITLCVYFLTFSKGVHCILPFEWHSKRVKNSLKGMKVLLEGWACFSNSVNTVVFLSKLTRWYKMSVILKRSSPNQLSANCQ